MTDRPLPRLIKWPFFVADAVLLLLAWWIMARSPHPLGAWPMGFLVVSVMTAFGFAVWPYVLEYQAALRQHESGNLVSAVQEIARVQGIADQIRIATSQWQTVQEHSGQTVAAAKEISDRMAVEARAFAEFMQKANDSEKGHLRLETEKLRRNEGEWLQVVVRLMDHVFALYQAGARSGQPNVREQLAMFQNACRDAVRRIGLVPLETAPDESFDPKRHQLLDESTTPPTDALVAETLATGYSFQGQMVRRSLVQLKGALVTPDTVHSAVDPARSTSPAPVPAAQPARNRRHAESGQETKPQAETGQSDWPESEKFQLESESVSRAHDARPHRE